MSGGLPLHHQGWSEARSRNSSAFVDLCDVTLGMSRIENTVTLKADKIRFQLEDVFPIHFELCGEGYIRRDTPPVASEDDQGGLEHGWSDDETSWPLGGGSWRILARRGRRSEKGCRFGNDTRHCESSSASCRGLFRLFPALFLEQREQGRK